VRGLEVDNPVHFGRPRFTPCDRCYSGTKTKCLQRGFNNMALTVRDDGNGMVHGQFLHDLDNSRKLERDPPVPLNLEHLCGIRDTQTRRDANLMAKFFKRQVFNRSKVVGTRLPPLTECCLGFDAHFKQNIERIYDNAIIVEKKKHLHNSSHRCSSSSLYLSAQSRTKRCARARKVTLNHFKCLHIKYTIEFAMRRRVLFDVQCLNHSKDGIKTRRPIARKRFIQTLARQDRQYTKRPSRATCFYRFPTPPFLLDTHSFLWWIGNDDRLSGTAHDAISDANNILPVTLSHSLQISQLPQHHRDPFDRMLVAQAQTEKARLVTKDPEIAKYAVNICW